MTVFLDTPVDPLSVSIPPLPLCDETPVTAAPVRDDEDSDDDAVVFVDAVAAVTPPATTVMESPQSLSSTPLTGPVKNLAHVPRGVSAAAAAATPPIQGKRIEYN